MRSKRRENIIIYSSLIAALICLALGAVDYFRDLSENANVKDEVESAIKEISPKDTQKKEKEIKDEEPEELKNIDKYKVVKKYLDEITDQIVKDEVINYEMLKSWGTYEITDLKYLRKIVDGYYSYSIDIKITAPNPVLPIEKNVNLSTSEYTVISFKVNLLKLNTETVQYIVKSFEV